MVTHKIMHGRELLEALENAGVIDRADKIRRVVIDVQHDDVVRIYVERLGDERLLAVTLTLDGVDISGFGEVPGSRTVPGQP